MQIRLLYEFKLVKEHQIGILEELTLFVIVYSAFSDREVLLLNEIFLCAGRFFGLFVIALVRVFVCRLLMLIKVRVEGWYEE